MQIPVLSPAWRLLSGVPWDVAVNSVELLSLGGHAWWWRLHLHAARNYLLDPPARVVLQEGPALHLPEGHCVYGETPLVSMLAMLGRVGIGPDDVFFDLGCGRGLTVLAAALRYGVRAVGIDAVPTLMKRARRMAADLDVADRVGFLEGDFLAQDLSAGTIFYVASTTFRGHVMRALAERIVAGRDEAARARLRAVTLSQPLGAPFRVLARARYPMTWGWNTVLFQDVAPADDDTKQGEPD